MTSSDWWRSRLEAAQDVHYKRLDVLPTDVGHVGGHALCRKERGELRGTFEVGRDRAWSRIRRSEMAAEGIDGGPDVPYNRRHGIRGSTLQPGRTLVPHERKLYAEFALCDKQIYLQKGISAGQRLNSEGP